MVIQSRCGGRETQELRNKRLDIQWVSRLKIAVAEAVFGGNRLIQMKSYHTPKLSFIAYRDKVL